jgi:hypothetical protein
MSAANEGLHKSFFHEQLLKISKKNKEAQWKNMDFSCIFYSLPQ